MNIPRNTYLMLPCCNTKMPIELVEILNIQENILGADIGTFKCPICKNNHTSCIYK